MYTYYDSHTNFALDVLLEYPNPLQPAEYPQYSSGEKYIGGELFLHFTQVCKSVLKNYFEKNFLKMDDFRLRTCLMRASLRLVISAPGPDLAPSFPGLSSAPGI